MRIIALICVHNEERYIVQCLEHLFNHGLEVYLLDQESTDRTVALAKQYLGKGLIEIETISRARGHILTEILQRKEELSSTLEADWFMHVDADEFRLPPSQTQTLAEAIADADAQGYNAINFLEYVFIPTIESPNHEHADFQETMRWYYFFMPHNPHRMNAWKRQDKRVNLTRTGGHRVSFEGLKMSPAQFKMRHYHFLSESHVKSKLVGRPYPKEELEGMNRGWRPKLRAEMIRLPSQSTLVEYTSDDNLEPCRPRSIHYLGELVEANEKMLAEEKLVVSSGTSKMRPTMTDHPHRSTYDQLLAVARAHPVSHIFVLNALRRGGMPRDACTYVAAIAEKVGIENILTIVSGVRAMPSVDWLPSGTRLVNLLELQPELSDQDAGIMLLDLIEEIDPLVVFNFNSRALWSALGQHFAAFRTEVSTRMMAYLGGYEIYVCNNLFGFNKGPISQSVDFMDLFIADSSRLCATMRSQYPSLGSRVVSCLKGITEPTHAVFASNGSHRLRSSLKDKILWAGRISQVKRPDVLAKIAQQMPDVIFEVFGYPFDGFDIGFLREIENIRYMGLYDDFSQIPIDDKAVLLYTSESDGYPNLLMEAGAAGLPIVCADAGGIGEIINDETGWLLPSCDDIEGYVKTLRMLLADPQLANQKAQRLQTLMDERHNWTAFRQRLDDLDIWSPSALHSARHRG